MAGKILLLIALADIALHTVVNHRYGFHRDELLTLDNAHRLSWGYVVYPPMTPFLARIELELFGTSLRGFRFFAAVSQGLVLLLTGLAARELGGKREAQLVACVAAAVGGHRLVGGSFFSYTSFDYLWWVMAGYLVIRLLKSSDARWWVAIGAAIGLGMLTKYTMTFLALGIVGGVLLTPARRYLQSPWLWCGAAVASLLMLLNVIWQIQHHFVALEFLKSIHTRDIGWGWTDYFLLNQFWKSTNIVTVPLWCAGLWYLCAVPEGRPFRMLAWMYIIPLVTLLAARGRDYYLAPAYPILIAAGTVWAERWVSSLSHPSAMSLRRATWITLTLAGVIAASVTLPIAPVNSAWWQVANQANGVFDNEIGWPELVATVAAVHDSLPQQQRANLGILTGDDGETGAVNLYGPAYGLPRAISGMNSNWMRGYGDPPPATVIVVGKPREFGERNFESCKLAGHLTNRWGIRNSSIDGYTDVFVCRNLRQPWPEFWQYFRSYG
jgi:hypothetical protein